MPLSLAHEDVLIAAQKDQPKKVLLLVDVQNVFYGARNYKEECGGVDYAKLPGAIALQLSERLGEPIEEENIRKAAYVIQTPRYRGFGFFSLLKRLGYELRVRHCDNASSENKGSVTGLMQMDLIVAADWYDIVVAVSGSGSLLPAFKVVKNGHNGTRQNCFVCAFPRTVHSAYTNSDLITGILPLGDNVLRDAR